MRRGILITVLVGGILGLTPLLASAQTQREFDTVRSWYNRYLGREPEQPGWTNWAVQLTQRPANDVLADILTSDEYFQRHGNSAEGFIVGLYTDVLGRRPSGEEVQSWVQQYWQERGNRNQVAREFLAGAGVELTTRQAPFVAPSWVNTPENIPLTPRRVLPPRSHWWPH